MEAKKNITELKEKLAESLKTWIEERIDSLAAANPKLKIASVYLKRGATNYIARESGKIDKMIDDAALFICDEEGNFSPDMLFDDLMTMLREMEEVPFGSGLMQGTIGKGVIRFKLPDNPVFSLLFGDTGAIKITEADFMELKDIFTE